MGNAFADNNLLKIKKGKEVKMSEQNRLILWGWYSPEIVKNRLIPDIEKNVLQFGVMFPIAYERFTINKYAVNSLYFHHSYAESDIPIGQEYTQIALMENYKILPASIQTCYSKIICFFTCNPKMQPSECAMRGHHESSLIQFEQGIPQIIYDELLEISELPFNPDKKQICLF